MIDAVIYSFGHILYTLKMKTIEIVYVAMTCAPENSEKFGDHLQYTAGDVRKMEGCIKFDCLNSPEDTNRFVAYLEFGCRVGLQRYKRSDAADNINKWLFPMLTRSPVYRRYQAVVIQSSDNL